MKTVLVVLGIIVLLLLLYVIFVHKASAKGAGAGGAKSDHDYIQATITRYLTSSDPALAPFLYSLDTQKIGGAHGVKASPQDAAQYVFRTAATDSQTDYTRAGKGTINAGVYTDYTYPNIEAHSNPNAGPGLGRDRSGGGINIAELLGAAGGGAVGGPFGALIGLFSGIFSSKGSDSGDSNISDLFDSITNPDSETVSVT